jgi:hypothetical protein
MEHLSLLIYVRILYHRNVYPTDDFHMVKKYGQVVMVTQDLGLERYLETVLAQVKGAYPRHKAIYASCSI